MSGVGSFPEREEILIGGAGVRRVVLGGQGSRQAELSQRIDHGSSGGHGAVWARILRNSETASGRLTIGEIGFAAQKMIVDVETIFIRLGRGQCLNRNCGLALPKLNAGLHPRGDFILDEGVFGACATRLGQKRLGFLVVIITIAIAVARGGEIVGRRCDERGIT